MAIALVHSGKTGSTNAASLVITAAAAGNILVVFQSTITGGEKAPSMSDNISGATGWFKHGVSASFSAGKGKVWLWTKLAVGGETELKASIAEAATNSGIAYAEMSGMTKELDLAGTTESSFGSVTSVETPAVSTAVGSAAFAGVAYSGADGGAKAGFQMVPMGAASSRVGGWWYVPPEGAITEKKWTLEWTTAREGSLLTVAFKAAGVHAHTLTISQGQTVTKLQARTGILPTITQAQAPTRVTTPARTLSTTQAQVVTRTPLQVGKSFAISQAQVASRAATKVARSLVISNAQAVVRLTALGKSLVVAQAQSVKRLAALARTFAIAQQQSYGPALPSTPITDELEEVEGFNGGGTWTVLAWSEIIGETTEFQKGLVGKPHPKGWTDGEGSPKKAGARYNVASFSNPLNMVALRSLNTLVTAGEEAYLAVGICVPSNGERSGYVARIQRNAEGNWIVTLERWINGAKTTLATTTVASAFFGVNETGKAAPFGITLVSGVLRVWLGASKAVATQLLEASDSTFTSGYNTIEAWGTKMMLSQEHATTTSGWVNVGAINGKVFTVTQTGAATLRHEAITRTLTVAQPQVISRQVSMTRSLTVAATQVVSRLASLTHSLKITQGQTPILVRTPSRTLPITQAQVTTRITSPARSLSITQGQSPSRAVALAKSLTATQGQAPTVAKATTRLFSITQGQAVSRLATVARTLVASAAQVVSRLANPARTLRIAQAQEVVMTGPAEHSNTPITLTCSGTQTARLLRTPVARTLRTSATQSPTLSRAMTRALSVAVTQVASRSTSLQRTLTCTGAQSTTFTATGAKSALLTTAAHQSLGLRRQIARTLFAAGAQTATIAAHVEEQPTPPPARMTSSVQSATNLTSTVQPALNMTSGVSTP